VSEHQLETLEQSHRCIVCRQTWKNPPTSQCPGVIVYAWGKWPEHLLTKKQMGDAGFQTGKKLPPPAGLVRRAKSPAGFDEAMIAGDCERHGIQHHDLDANCAMLAYAAFIGDYSRYWGNYRWQPLNGSHTVLSDCRACLALIRRMAGQKERT